MAVRTYGPWIEWDGRTKRCPLASGTPHQVRFQDGTTAHDDSPETWEWKRRREANMNIIAYRVLK